jgi:nitroimidazol reductase NimA-like FMN-containing flavoprotein (pyridoxamine 5'-phosphate oxidase superfamily)
VRLIIGDYVAKPLPLDPAEGIRPDQVQEPLAHENDAFLVVYQQKTVNAVQNRFRIASYIQHIFDSFQVFPPPRKERFLMSFFVVFYSLQLLLRNRKRVIIKAASARPNRPGARRNAKGAHSMRRKESEITDVYKKLEIIGKNKVCRLALSENDQPYIVPLNYGYSFENGALTLYFHSAKEGKKLEIIRKNNLACFEIDNDSGDGLIKGDTPCDHSYAFQSIVGTGRILLLDALPEKKDALNKLTRHMTGSDETYDFPEKALEAVAVYKMEVAEFTGKEEKA